MDKYTFEKRTIRLGETQNFTFDVLSNKQNVQPSKVYVSFKNTSN